MSLRATCPSWRKRGNPSGIFSNMTDELSLQNNHEVISSEPVGIQYFRAVDMMVDGLKPSDGKYFDIKVYGGGRELPSVKILRIQNNYSDGKIGKQDEIEIDGRKNRLQLNAECDSIGSYIDYPKELSEFGTEYLFSVVKELSSIVAVDGAVVVVNGTDRMMSKQGMWWVSEKGYSRKDPRLMEPKKQLPE